MKKLMTLLLALALGCSLLTACGSNQPTTEEEAITEAAESANPTELETIVITEPIRGYTWAPVYLAETLGYFAEEGLEADFQSVTGMEPVTAVFSGDAQFALGGIDAAMVANEAGQDAKIIVSTGQKYPYQLIGADETYSTMESLRGGVIAGGQSAISCPQTFAAACVRQAGMEPGVDVTLITMGSPNYAAAIEAGEVQAVVGTNPWISKQIVDNGGVVIVDGTDSKVMTEMLGTDKYELFTLLTSGDYIQNNPETVQKAVNAVVKAMDWMETASPEEIANALLPLFEDRYDELLYDAQVDKEKELTSGTGYHSQEGFQAGVTIAKLSGGITKDVAEENLYDESFLDNAWANLEK